MTVFKPSSKIHFSNKSVFYYYLDQNILLPVFSFWRLKKNFINLNLERIWIVHGNIIYLPNSSASLIVAGSFCPSVSGKNNTRIPTTVPRAPYISDGRGSQISAYDEIKAKMHKNLSFKLMQTCVVSEMKMFYYAS